MEFTFDVGQTPIIGRRYVKGGLGQVSLPGQASAGSSTVSSATSESLREKEQVRMPAELPIQYLAFILLQYSHTKFRTLSV